MNVLMKVKKRLKYINPLLWSACNIKKEQFAYEFALVFYVKKV
ncbi:hypothetical protein [Bacillus cereus]|nr:hypothetical protein [Bacillus cereus]